MFAALIETIDAPLFLLGHSYGAQTALAAAGHVLVLYEPPWPRIIRIEMLARLEELASTGDWDGFTATFFSEVLSMPVQEVNELRATRLWALIVADAEASLGDLRALSRFHFDPERFRELRVPVLLQIGSESFRDLYVTDALAAVLPDARLERLPGQGHDGMITAPGLYAEAVSRFLLS